MTSAVDLTALPDWLAQQATTAAGDVAILAGHFAIYSGGGAAVDLLERTEEASGAMAEMLAFTEVTWRAGVMAAAKLGTNAPRLVVLVDDIQFVRPAVGDKSKEERLAAALAENYLEATTRLPRYHQGLLAEHQLSEEIVLPASPERWLFSERELRIAAVRHVRTELAAGRATDLAESEDGQTVTVTLPEHGGYCLVHSGRTTCAGGYLELLAALQARGIRKLIAMVPMRCLGPVGLGTLLARRLFPAPGFDVVNVAIPDPSLGLPARVFVDGAD